MPLSAGSSVSNNAKHTSTYSGVKIAHSNVPSARARTWLHGDSITTDLDANGTGATAASAPSMTSPILTPPTPLLLCLACSSRRIARELGGHVWISYLWCWRLCNATLSYEKAATSQCKRGGGCIRTARAAIEH